jgi:hypothetical protein
VETVRHYFPAVFFALLAIATIVATDLLSRHDWADAYGPNIAASFVELFLVASLVDFFIRRETKKKDEPMRRATHAQVATILTDVLLFMQSIVKTATPGAQPRGRMRAYDALAAAWPAACQNVDLAAASERSEGYLSPLQRWTSRTQEAHEKHLAAAADIARYCDAELAAALRELMRGEAGDAVWDQLRDVTTDPSAPWWLEPEQARGFEAAVRRSLRAFREGTDERVLAGFRLP